VRQDCVGQGRMRQDCVSKDCVRQDCVRQDGIRLIGRTGRRDKNGEEQNTVAKRLRNRIGKMTRHRRNMGQSVWDRSKRLYGTGRYVRGRCGTRGNGKIIPPSGKNLENVVAWVGCYVNLTCEICINLQPMKIILYYLLDVTNESSSKNLTKWTGTSTVCSRDMC
jgi:hypothetical protein